MRRKRPMETLDFGQCCACGRTINDVSDHANVICLPKRAPEPGTGWGCQICHLARDGAVAAVCDHCLETNAQIQFAICGYPSGQQRIPIDRLEGEFAHDLSLHSNAEEANKGVVTDAP